jgi:hypothetical protein
MVKKTHAQIYQHKEWNKNWPKREEQKIEVWEGERQKEFNSKKKYSRKGRKSQRQTKENKIKE